MSEISSDKKIENVLIEVARLERQKFKEIETLNFEEMCSFIENYVLEGRTFVENLFWLLRGLDSKNNEIKKMLVIKYAERIKNFADAGLVLRAINTIMGEGAVEIRQELSAMLNVNHLSCTDLSSDQTIHKNI